MELDNQDIQDITQTIVQTNIAAEDAKALSTAIGIANNEISNLTHSLLCLDDETFERYVLSIRTLREVSKSFDIAQKSFMPGYVPSENKIDFDNIQEKPKQKNPRNSLEGVMPIKNISFSKFIKQNLNVLGESKSLKDFCSFVLQEYWGLDSNTTSSSTNHYVSMRINNILSKCNNVIKISRGCYAYLG